MDKKKDFTKKIEEAAKIAKQAPQALTSSNVVAGGGALIRNDKSEYGYDLRLLEEKGILPANHPVRLAAQFNPKPSAQTPPLIEELKSKLGKGFFKLVIVENSEENRIYFDPENLSPLQKELEPFYIPLESGVAIAFAQNEDQLAKMNAAEDEAFFLAYLEFAHHVLINKGIGRIKDIQDRVKLNAPSDWKVNGCYIFIPRIKDKEAFLKDGLLVTDKNIMPDGILLNIPVSIFDLQIDDVVNRVKEITE